MRHTLQMTVPRRMNIGEDEVTFFESELLQHPLLTPEQEIKYSTRYHFGLAISAQRKTLEEKLGREASAEEVGKALQLDGLTESSMQMILKSSQIARRSLVNSNMRLVFHIAKFYRNRGLSVPDLVFEGIFGLMRAVDKFDPKKGFRFSTYASWWIKQRIARAIAEKSRIVRLPVHIHDIIVSINRAQREFAVQNNGRKPNVAELADRLCLPIEKVQSILAFNKDVDSTDEAVISPNNKIGGGYEMRMKDRLTSEGSEPWMLNEHYSLLSEVQLSMESLSVREADVIEMRYGISSGHPMTLCEVGKHFGVTRERIRQIQAKALLKMRASPATESKLQAFKDLLHDRSMAGTRKSASVGLSEPLPVTDQPPVEAIASPLSMSSWR